MNLTVKKMCLVSMFAALACAGGLMMKFGGAGVVPFSILPMIALLAGLLLGGRLGALSMVVYVIIGLVGIPVFSSAPFGGPAYLVKPTAGFLFGFIGGAMACGALNRKLGGNSLWSCMISSVVGLAVIYAIGLPYLYVVLNFVVGKSVNIGGVVKIGFLPFIGFDLIKALIVSAVAVPVTKQVGVYKYTR